MRRPLGVTSLILAFTLGLSACGGGAGAGGASSAGPSETSVTSKASIIDGDPLTVTPGFAPVDGNTVEIAQGVSVTVPSPLGQMEDFGSSRGKAIYYGSANDLGMIDVDTSSFGYETVNLQARSEWQNYSEDGASPSGAVQIDWPGAVDAYAFTWSQEADSSVFNSTLSGVIKVDGVALLLRTESGQDVYLAAYAASGGLEDSAALAALNSVTIDR